MKRIVPAALAALVAVPMLAGAQTSPAVPTAKPLGDLQACRTIADSAQRLACYDRGMDALNAATQRGDVAIVERGEVRKARKGLFGFTLPRIGFLTGKPDNAEDVADEQRLETVVTASRALPNGKWRFTVEGGAIWETVEANMGFRDPLPGKKVLIEKGSLGGYFVSVEKGRRVQAKRIG